MKSRWIVRTVFLYGAVEICDTKNDNVFKINGQHLKPFLKSVPEADTTMGLLVPMYQNITSLLFILYSMHAYLHSYIGDNA